MPGKLSCCVKQSACQPSGLTLQNMLMRYVYIDLVCDHAGILNRVEWMQRAYPMTQHDVIAFKTSPCFVDHLLEMFAPLLTGSWVCLMPRNVL